MPPAHANKSMRYVLLGFPRSGTTLLSRLLDAHPQISCPPETHLMTAAARFLSEQTAVEGPPIGVLSGVGFLGVEAEEVMAPLRQMIFGMHDRFAGDADLWVEKTGVDIFHLEALEPLLAGHVRFILLSRNPLDVVASNMDLIGAMGAPLTDLAAAMGGAAAPHDGIARAWADRMQAMQDFAARHPQDCHSLRFEDLTGDPATTLSSLLEFLGLPGDGAALVAAARTAEPRFGLGDFKVNETLSIRPPDANGWRKRLPRMAAARIIPILAPGMAALGYNVPKPARIPSREDAVRQYAMAAQMKRSAATEGQGG